MEELTQFQAFALDNMPRDRWFDPYDLKPIIRRPHFTCKELYGKGYLNRKEYYGRWQYRIKS
jgi:hypothetical protein